MRLEDLGIDKNGVHNRTLTAVESHFAGLLIEHQGEANAVPADVLALMFADGQSEESAQRKAASWDTLHDAEQRRIEQVKRDVRTLQNHLLFMHDHLPVFSRAGVGGGYWLAENEAEAVPFFGTFRSRALTGLRKASRGKAAIMADVVKQLVFEFEAEADKLEQTGMIKPRAAMPAPIEVVDAVLEKMARDPEKFADGLRKIGAKYGSILMPRAQMASIARKAAELQRLVGEIGV